MNNTQKFKLDFIGIGAQRAATTWIAECLREHPEICLAQPKEIEFFDLRYHFGLPWYQRHFNAKKSHQFFGEYTSTYIYSPLAAQNIRKHFPDAKILVSLRNPIDRLISHLPEGEEARLGQGISTEEFLKKYDDLIKRGFYYSHLKHFFELFPKENILIMIYEDIGQGAKGFMGNIYKFIGAQPDFVAPSTDKIINPKRHYKAPGVKRFLDRTMDFIEERKIGPYLKKILIKIGARRLFYFLDDINSIPIEEGKLPDNIKKELQNLYQGDVEKLSKWLNRELWQDTFV